MALGIYAHFNVDDADKSYNLVYGFKMSINFGRGHDIELLSSLNTAKISRKFEQKPWDFISSSYFTFSLAIVD